MNENLTVEKIFNVLSLEDSDRDFEIISEHLINAGYNLKITRVETEKDFTQAISHTIFDIILADYNLPNFDAFRALDLHNTICPEVPFICVSGSIGEYLAIELLKKGAVDYVLKDRLERLPFAVKRAIEEATEKHELKQTEAALRKSEEKYRTIFENVQDVFYQTDLQGIIREVSPSIKYFSDFYSDELIGKSVYEIYFDINERKALLKALAEKGEIRDYRLRLQTKSKEARFASINARLIVDEQGNPDHIDGAIRDITDRINDAESLRLSEEKFRTIFQDHAAVKLLLDAETSKIIDANYSASRFYGWSIDELKNMSISDISTSTPDEIKNTIEQIRNLEKVNFEFLHRCKDGSLKNVEILSSKIVIAGKDFLHTIIHDISDKKKAEQQLQLLSLSMEQSPVSVSITNIDGKIEYVNPAYTRITGYTFEEVKDQPDRVIRTACLPDEFYKNLVDTIYSGKVWNGEIKNKRKNGESFWENVSIAPLLNDKGKITHFVNINEDITEKRKMVEDLISSKEKAEASNRLKTAFMNNISHEIRTPLNGILGFAPMIIDPSYTTEDKEKFLEILNFSSKRLMQTVTDYMDISLITSGNIDVKKSEFAPCELFREIETNYRSRCNVKNIALKMVLPELFDNKVINSDRPMMVKILAHLMDNAVKFTKEGVIILAISARGSKLDISIQDTGVGIKEEALPVIFEHFMQEDVSNTRGHEGSGLGLSIVKGLVGLLGGSIRVESVKGKGSTFFLTLPGLKELDAKAKDTAVNNEKPKNYKPTILIAEDDDDVFLYLEIILAKDCKLIRAKEGQKAIDICQVMPEIDLIFMDIKMPGISGLIATREIRKFRKELPIVALTAYAETGIRERCLDAGCNEYLTKPVEKATLYELLGRFGLGVGK